MALYATYGNNMVLHGADALVIHRSHDPRVVMKPTSGRGSRNRWIPPPTQLGATKSALNIP
jgi:hypothetical protein